MSATLQFDNQPSQPLLADRYLLGRSSKCDIILPDGDTAISRQHAVLERQGDDFWTLQDLSSRNGTRVNSQRISGTFILKDGDKIRIGDSTLVFRMSNAERLTGQTITLSPEELPTARPPEPTAPPMQEPAAAPRPREPLAVPRVYEQPVVPTIAPPLNAQDRHTMAQPKSSATGWLGSILVLLSLFAYLIVIKPIIDEYNKPPGEIVRNGGKVLDKIEKALPIKSDKIHEEVEKDKQTSEKHSERYNLAIMAQQVCLGLGLIGGALIGYSLFVNRK